MDFREQIEAAEAAKKKAVDEAELEIAVNDEEIEKRRARNKELREIIYAATVKPRAKAEAKKGKA